MQEEKAKDILSVWVIGLAPFSEKMESTCNNFLSNLQLGLDFIYSREVKDISYPPKKTKTVVLCSSQTDITSISSYEIIPIIFDSNEALHESSKHINAFLYDHNDKEKSDEMLCHVILEKFGLIKNTKNVFISYRREDSLSLAENIRTQLLMKGYSIFLDKKSIDVGVDFMDSIKLAIANADVFLLLYSPSYFDSVYTKKEMYAACIARIPIIILSWEKAEDVNTYGFKHQKLQNCYSISTIECDDLIENINRLQEKTQVFRFQKLRRIYENFNQEGEISLSSFYVPSMRAKEYSSYHAIFGIPTTMDLEKIQKKEDNKCIRSSAIYDDLCIPYSYYKHIEWLNNELTHIKMYRMSTIQGKIDEGQKEDNKTPCVFLSASVPNANDKNYDFLKIHEIVVILTSEIIRRGGTLVFGGHPTITPIIQNIIEITRVNRQKIGCDDYPDVRLYQSKYYEGEYPLEVKLFPQNLIRETAVEEIPNDDGEKSKTKNASLELMRNRMIHEDGIKYTSAIFLGGKYKDKPEDSGVWREYQMFKEFHQTACRILIEGTGEIPKLLKEKECKDFTRIGNLAALL